MTKRHFDKRSGSRLQSQLKLTSAPIVEVICQKFGLRASSRVLNTEKQMKARGLAVFGTRDEARSPSFLHVFSNETIRNV